MMQNIFMQIALFARGNVFEGGRRFSQKHSDLSFAELALGVVIFVSFIALLVLLFKIFTPPEKPRGVNSPLRLFWSLCRAHQLKFTQCWLLWKISRALEMDDPALLFVEPELFDPDIIGKPLSDKAADIKSLQERIFGEVAENAA